MKAEHSLKVVLGSAVVLGVGAALWVGVATLMRNPLDDLSVPTSGSPNTDSAASEADAPAHRNSTAAKLVGSKACEECHPEAYRTYQGHPMWYSTRVVQASGTVEDEAKASSFTVPRAPDYSFVTKYEVLRTPEQVGHRRVSVDLEGKEICDRTVPVHYAVGSGTRGFSYFTNFNGVLFMSPVTWYTGAKSWDNSPGYVTNDEHFERRILDGCVACHVGQAAPRSDIPHVFEREPFVELEIGCERCHGPGADHIAFRTANPDATSKDDPIVNPDRLSQPLRDDVCFQCHLLGVTRVAHKGLRDFDYVPGQAMADVWTVLMHGNKISGTETTEAVGQVEQMMSSRCYQLSDGRLGCTSCHGSHSVPTRENRVAFYRDRCLACHEKNDRIDCSLDVESRLKKSPEDSCMVCHMPRLSASDVPHTSQTDHRVMRVPSEMTRSSEEKGTLDVYQQDRLTEEQILRAKGIFLAQQAEMTESRVLGARAAELLSPLIQKSPDDVAGLEALGKAHSLAYDPADAEIALLQALKIRPDSEDALRSLMLMYHENGKLEDGIRYGRRLLEVNPWHYQYHGRMAHMLARQGNMKEAIEFGLKAAEIQPWNYQIHGWLAEAGKLADRPDLVTKHSRLFEQLKPDSVKSKP